MVRKVSYGDAESIRAIYNYYVLNTVVTFETKELSADEMFARIKSVSQNFPFLVIETGAGKIAGFAYAHHWKERAAYAGTWENSIYVSPEFAGLGFGSALMKELILQCKAGACTALIACITAENSASAKFHEKFGFFKVSHFKCVGVKFGRALDVEDWELLLS